MLLEYLANAYLWIKAFHIIAAIAWMVGLLYLPRLFVYHCDAPKGSLSSETFETMERRLLHGIMTPAMLVTWMLGLGLLIVSPAVDWENWWLHLKLLAVIGLTALHICVIRWQRLFLKDANRHGALFFRLVNEVPTLLMIVIIIMVVVKPV